MADKGKGKGKVKVSGYIRMKLVRPNSIKATRVRAHTRGKPAKPETAERKGGTDATD